MTDPRPAVLRVLTDLDGCPPPDDEQMVWAVGVNARDEVMGMRKDNAVARLSADCGHTICLMEEALHECGKCSEHDQIVVGVYCPLVLCCHHGRPILVADDPAVRGASGAVT